jgi:hypothetical protein
VEGGTPDATPVAHRDSFPFTVDEPGDYYVECYTPADDDNFIRRGFTVEP